MFAFRLSLQLLCAVRLAHVPAAAALPKRAPDVEVSREEIAGGVGGVVQPHDR